MDAERPFSQAVDMSQMSLSLTPHEEASGYTAEVEDVVQPPEEQDFPEENLSARAESIVEQNQQITAYVESNLKRLEKRRLNLINKNKRIDEDIEKYSQIYEEQKQTSLQLQMEIEQASEQYQNELQQRPQLLEKLKRTVVMTDMFASHFAEAENVGLEIEKEKNNIIKKFKECKEKSKSVNIKARKCRFMAEMEEKLKQCQKLRDGLLSEREKQLSEIQHLANQNMEKAKKICDTQEKIKKLSLEDQQLATTISVMVEENKTLQEEIHQHQLRRQEVRATGNSQIQNLMLRINTEQSINANLEVKSKEREHCLNSSLTKLKELTNLSDQLKNANEESEMRIFDHEKKIEEYKKQNAALSAEIKSLEVGIRKYDDVENVNKMYKSEMSEMRENMKRSEVVLQEKEESVTSLSNKLESLKQRLSGLEEDIVEIDEDLQLATSAKEDLYTRVMRNKFSFEEERKNNILRNEQLETKNLELSYELNKLLAEIEDMKGNNSRLNAEAEEMKASIKKYNENAVSSDEKLIIAKNELQEISSKYTERISAKNKQLDEYQELLNEAKPTLYELPIITAKKSCLEQAILEQREKYQQNMESMDNNHSTSILEMEKELENYRSIMKGLLQKEDECIEKTIEEIRETEKTKLKEEDEVKHLITKLNSLKAVEASKRSQVAKVEKRLRAINNEVKVTRQDISEAISEKTKQEPLTKRSRKGSKNLMTPNSSLDSINKRKEGAAQKKKMTQPTPPHLYSNMYNDDQTTQKKWDEPVHEEDEYEFSDL